MSKERASFTSDVVMVLLAILPEHITPASGKTNWQAIATTVNTRMGKHLSGKQIQNWFANMKERHKAWNELKKWTGIGWSAKGCPIVDKHSEKWESFLKQYKGHATYLLKYPFENEAEWDKILRGHYATGDRSWAPGAGLDNFYQNDNHMEEGSGDSEDNILGDDTPHINIPATESASPPTMIHARKRRSSNFDSNISKRTGRETNIDTCLDILRKSMSVDLTQSSSPPNKHEKALASLESMEEITKHGSAFLIEVYDTLNKIPSGIDLFNTLRSDEYRILYLKRNIRFPDDEVYRPHMPTADDDDYVEFH